MKVPIHVTARGPAPAGRGAPGGRPGFLGRAFPGRVRWSRVDWPILIVGLLLLATGVTFVGEMARVDQELGRDDILFSSHFKKLALTMPTILLGVLVRPRWLRRNAWWIYFGAIVLLALVPIVGEERNSARRWIPIPGLFDLQPSEIAKLALILALARVLYRSRLRRLSEWWRPAAVALLPMVMVAAQPDLGTAMTVVPVALGMAYLAGARGRVLGGLVLGVALLGICAWKLEWVQEYQLRRIETWVEAFDPQTVIDDKNGDSYQTYHSRTAVGNGSWTGTGLGSGIANLAGHLPERESDLIFSVVAEEGGFLGASLLVLLYTLLVCLILGTAGRIRERYSRLVVGGIGLYFGAHFFINVGVNLGLLPMTGLTLPLLSTGGSSLLVTFLALGLAIGLAAHAEPSLDEDAFRA